MKKKLMIGVISAIVVICAASLLAFRNTNKKVPPAVGAAEAPKLETVVIELAKPTSNIKLPGDLIAWNETRIYAKVKSFVNVVRADRGSHVRKGDLLAVLEAPEIVAQLSREHAAVTEIQARYVASRASYSRLLKSSATIGAVSQNELDLAKAQMSADSANLLASQAAYEATRQLTQYLLVTAPYDGVISYRGISPGSLVGPEDITKDKPLFSLEDASSLRLTVAIPEKYVDELIEGSNVSFTVDAFPHQAFHAVLKRKAGRIEQDVRSMMVEFDVPNRSGELKPGMYVDVAIPIQRRAGTFNIPSSALLNSTQGTFVIVVRDGKAAWIPVITGNLSDESVEVFGDLQPGMKIVKKASEEIRDGEAVAG